MIEVGKFHNLKVVRITKQGFYLNEVIKEEADILLPGNQVAKELAIDEEIEVFIYRDSEDRKIATINKPKLVAGEFAPLKVVSVTHLGAFLDWGLEKDLFLPFKQQIGTLHKGDVCFVGIYIDKSDRLCATMKVYPLLMHESPYGVNAEVCGTIYSIKEAFGAFVAVDNKYHGLIPTKEFFGRHQIGEEVICRVRHVKSDGKLELSLRKTTHLQMEEDAQKIMRILEENEGFLRLHDKSSPDEINEILEMSKAAFKRALGRLLKEGAIEIKESGISRSW